MIEREKDRDTYRDKGDETVEGFSFDLVGMGDYCSLCYIGVFYYAGFNLGKRGVVRGGASSRGCG